MRKGCNKKRTHNAMRRWLAATMAVVCVLTSGSFSVQEYEAKTDISLEDYEQLKDNYSKEMGYREYLQKMPTTRPADKYVIDAA